MKDVVDDKGFEARRLLSKGKGYPLRERMREFISDHDSDVELKELRSEVSGGKPVSEMVDEGREERF